MSAIRPSPSRAHPPPTQEDHEEQREIRQRLMQRLAIAICLIVGVAIAITMLNRLEGNPPAHENGPAINPLQAESAPPTAAVSKTEALPSSPPIAESTPSEVLTTPPDSASTSPLALGDVAPEPTVPSNPILNNPHTEEKKAPLTEPTEKATTEKMTPKHHYKAAPVPDDPDGGSATEPAQPQPRPLVRPNPPPAMPLADNKPSPTFKTPAPTAVLPPPPPQRAAQPVKPTPEHTFTALAAGVLPAGSRGYTVQAGVFQSGTNAEKLIEKLNGAGIPARLETRVQVGPFKNREEAALIMRRLRELGVTPILQSPTS
ncbi:SPOR domain-containing protein [Chitinimonas sp. BJB300]|uniref:SPOR domain-containing protein n=1 Tax=Chitinimonas sp. BJB300 TaxID=1559339 RepID=UPI000C0DBB1A|nr:SPOR domain-containing protein [Chitinimonas sp. BJB300]PHV13004.1 hypothetical protein CSQ89_02735 [Chitinimonas sp. BJB300]TSJ88939.1 hypothetical protein FG002_008590 [Chitinimonas sp. BJB300]